LASIWKRQATNSLRCAWIVGTKVQGFVETPLQVEASGVEIVTVAVRRVNVTDPAPDANRFIDPKKVTYLPNTAGCFTARMHCTLRLVREAGG
jgi:thiazole synthase